MESSSLIDTFLAMLLRFELGTGDAKGVVRDSEDLTVDVDTEVLATLRLRDPDNLTA